MIAIETKYLPATNTRGARIKAFTCNGHSVSASYDYALSAAGNHYQAAQVLIEKHLKAINREEMVNMRYGATKTGYVFCLDQSKVSNII